MAKLRLTLSLLSLRVPFQRASDVLRKRNAGRALDEQTIEHQEECIMAVDISGLRLARIAPTAAIVQWETSVPADSCVEYEPVLNYGASPARDRAAIVLGPELTYRHCCNDFSLVTDHRVVLRGLRPTCGYYVRVRSARDDLASPWKDTAFMTRADKPSFPASGSRLKEWLLAQADTLSDSQRMEREQIRSLADLRAYQTGVREKFLRALGGFPERTPLNPRVLRVIDRGEYVIENIVFESLPGFFVPGNLYRPKSLSAPAPGILGVCGHAVAGKSQPQVIQMTDINLVQKGYVVFQIDPPGQNEMGWNGEPWTFREMHYNGSGYAHNLMALNSLLVGHSLTRYFLWDGIRAVDYLTSRQEVDAEKVGIWGCSGGGGQSMYIAAIDERIKAAVPIIAPRSLTIVGAAKEGIPLWALQAPYEELKGIYDRVRASAQLALGLVEGFHCEQSVRQFAYWTFNRAFGKEGEGLREVDRSVLPSSVGPEGKRQSTPLDVAPHSSMVRDFHSATVQTLLAETATDLAARRPTPATNGGWEPYCADLRRRIGACLRLQGGREPAVIFESAVERDGFTIQRLSCGVEPGIVLRLEIYEPEVAQPRIPVLYLRDQVPPAGDLLVGASDLYDLMTVGHTVLTVEVRGLNDPGLYEDTIVFGVSTHHTRRVHEALAVGRPLFGQRVCDVLAAARVLGDHAARSGGITLIGDGVGGLWGMYAAVFDTRISAVAVRDGLSSYQSVMETSLPTWVQSDRESSVVIPGALESFDLPDVASLLAPRPLRISRSVDGSNQLLPLARLKNEYARTRARYEALGAGRRFVVSESNSLSGWEGLGVD